MTRVRRGGGRLRAAGQRTRNPECCCNYIDVVVGDARWRLTANDENVVWTNSNIQSRICYAPSFGGSCLASIGDSIHEVDVTTGADLGQLAASDPNQTAVPGLGQESNGEVVFWDDANNRLASVDTGGLVTMRGATSFVVLGTGVMVGSSDLWSLNSNSTTTDIYGNSALVVKKALASHLTDYSFPAIRGIVADSGVVYVICIDDADTRYTRLISVTTEGTATTLSSHFTAGGDDNAYPTGFVLLDGGVYWTARSREVFRHDIGGATSVILAHDGTGLGYWESLDFPDATYGSSFIIEDSV